MMTMTMKTSTTFLSMMSLLLSSPYCANVVLGQPQDFSSLSSPTPVITADCNPCQLLVDDNGSAQGQELGLSEDCKTNNPIVSQIIEKDSTCSRSWDVFCIIEYNDCYDQACGTEQQSTIDQIAATGSFGRSVNRTQITNNCIDRPVVVPSSPTLPTPSPIASQITVVPPTPSPIASQTTVVPPTPSPIALSQATNTIAPTSNNPLTTSSPTPRRGSSTSNRPSARGTNTIRPTSSSSSGSSSSSTSGKAGSSGKSGSGKSGSSSSSSSSSATTAAGGKSGKSGNSGAAGGSSSNNKSTRSSSNATTQRTSTTKENGNDNNYDTVQSLLRSESSSALGASSSSAAATTTAAYTYHNTNNNVVLRMVFSFVVSTIIGVVAFL